MGFQVDWYNHLIHITSPQTEVLVQDLYNFIKDIESSTYGISYDEICGASGKDDLDEGVQTGITLELYSPWQVRFWDGSYIATVKGGNLVGGLAGDVIAYTPNVQVLVIQAAASTVVQTGGSALTTSEHNKLMTGLDISIPDGVWDEIRTAHVAAGSFGAIDEWAGEVDEAAIADAVWDEDLTDHLVAGTTGRKLSDGGTGDPDEIAAAVWDATSEDYDDEGTMGELQNQIDTITAAKPKVVPGR